MDSRYMNLKKINKMFLNCYFETPNLEANYQRLINDDATDFSRYTFFYVDYLLKKNNYQKANSILNNQLQNTPRNLLLNQLKGDIEINKKNLLQNNFNCKNISHIVAEIFYITANALSSQSLYALSNFYLNIAKYLNQDFYSYNTLLAENFVMMGNYQEAEKIYLLLKKIGETYDWHSSKQIAIMDVNNENTNKAIRSMQKSYQNLKKPNLYQTYDLANFLKNNEKFSQSIKYYSEVLKKISETHELYPKAKDGRGIAFEQLNKWDQAEKDFLDSLKVKPDQAYVMNYLAYSWIEKGININKSLRMLERANRLRTNDGYIIDSLGWALFKLKKYDEAKKYLQKAVKLMPSDPVINDHFADTLWMNGEKIQARYYWKYVLSLEKTKISLKDKIAKKILNGPASLN
jgi:tetratricopeptide (TPR) repeat protein